MSKPDTIYRVKIGDEFFFVRELPPFNHEYSSSMISRPLYDRIEDCHAYQARYKSPLRKNKNVLREFNKQYNKKLKG